MTPEKTVERLCMYRRLLMAARREGRQYVFSHDLAEAMGGTAAQVRRDLMTVGVSGNSRKGYAIGALIAKIGALMDNPSGERVALVGVGNVGCALLPFLAGYYPGLKVVAAFDSDPRKTGRVIHGCRCHPVEELEIIARERRLTVAIVATPASAAQAITDRLVACGVSGILNFAPVPLKVPAGVHVERVDIAMALEKAAYLARTATREEAPSPVRRGGTPGPLAEKN